MINFLDVKAQRASVEKQTNKIWDKIHCGGWCNNFCLFFSPQFSWYWAEREIWRRSRRLLKNNNSNNKPDIQEIQKDASQLSGEGEGLDLALIYLQLWRHITGPGKMILQGWRIRTRGKDEYVQKPATMVTEKKKGICWYPLRPEWKGTLRGRTPRSPLLLRL